VLDKTNFARVALFEPQGVRSCTTLDISPNSNFVLSGHPIANENQGLISIYTVTKQEKPLITHRAASAAIMQVKFVTNNSLVLWISLTVFKYDIDNEKMKFYPGQEIKIGNHFKKGSCLMMLALQNPVEERSAKKNMNLALVNNLGEIALFDLEQMEFKENLVITPLNSAPS
jgi:hypothetical protein